MSVKMLNLLPRHVPRLLLPRSMVALGISTLSFLALLSFSIDLLLPLVVIFASYKGTESHDPRMKDVSSDLNRPAFCLAWPGLCGRTPKPNVVLPSQKL